MQFTTFLISRAKQIYTNPLNVSEGIIKLKIMSYWPFFQILHMSEVICKQKILYEQRIGKFFIKTVNAMTFTGDILESPCKVIKRPKK